MSHLKYTLKSKKGLSDLIATVLIIGMVVAMASLVFFWSSNLFKSSTEETSKTTEKTLKCFNDIQLSILDVCYDDKIIIDVENKKDADINGNFLLIKIDGNEDSFIQPTPPGINLLPFEKRKITLTYFPEVGIINKVSIIPRIIGDTGPIFCTENIAESTNIKEGCNSSP